MKTTKLTAQQMLDRGIQKYTFVNFPAGVLALIMVFFIFTKVATTVSARKVSCSNFTSQSEAQRSFEMDRVFYKNLDRDKDGIACDALLK